jgi:hypothetical protein
VVEYFVSGKEAVVNIFLRLQILPNNETDERMFDGGVVVIDCTIHIGWDHRDGFENIANAVAVAMEWCVQS